MSIALYEYTVGDAKRSKNVKFSLVSHGWDFCFKNEPNEPQQHLTDVLWLFVQNGAITIYD